MLKAIQNNIPQTIKDILYIVAGIIFAGFALKSFLVPNNFLDGGLTGMSLLIHEFLHFNLGISIIVLNIPFIIMGGYQINRRYAYKTLACVIGLALCLSYIPYPNDITQDKLLVSIFGGFFLGTGVGLAMRGGCAIDGIEVLALYTLKRSSFSITEIILGINTIIFLIAASYLGLSTALYSMLTYYVAGRTIDYVIEGLEEYTGVTIISGKSEEIKEALVIKLGRGITVYKGERGFLKDSFDISQPCDIVFTIATRLEVRRLKNLVHNLDPKAFIFTNSIKEAAGGVLKQRSGHRH
ncbi:MAG: YitT family protein [Bacteroidetes bacterium]|nr:YitT family protein [Bacteroidota bacterium]